MSSVQDELALLISSFVSASNVSEQLGCLDCLTTKVLPALPLCEVEPRLFSRILPRVYDIVLGELSNIAQVTAQKQNDRSVPKIQEHLQGVKSSMDCLENCITYSQKCVEPPEQLSISSVQSLLSAVGQTVKATFTHCKDSEVVYGDLFEMVSDELSLMFRRTYQLQKGLMELLDRIQLSCDEEVVFMAEACHQLLEICIVIGDLDMSLLVNTWKVLSRLVTKHGEHMRGYLKVDQVIAHLCSSVEAKVNQWVKVASQCNQENLGTDKGCPAGDQKALEKLTKVVRFLLGHLVHLVKEFHSSLGLSVADLLHLLLFLHSQVSPSPTAPKLTLLTMQELKSSVLTGVEPLLLVLVRNREFADLVTRKDQDPTKHIFAYCRVLTSLLIILSTAAEDVLLHWMDPSKDMSILQAVFHYTKMCPVEIGLPVYVEPGIQCKGKLAREVSLYEDICTNTCAFVTAAPAACFHDVEQCLLENLLGDSVVAVLLASDVWVFMARCAAADLCASHVTFLIQLVKVIPRSKLAHTHVCQLVRRLVHVMSPQYQSDLFKAYPPSKPENLLVWSVLPLQALPDTLKRRVYRCIVPLCVQTVQACVMDSSSPANSKELVDCLPCLRALYRVKGVDTNVAPVHQVAVLELVSRFWIRDVTVAGDEMSEDVQGSLVALCSVLLPFMEAEMFAKITTGMKDLLNRSPAVHTRLAVAEFLGKCGKKDVPSSLEASVLSNISSMFSTLVSDAEWIVHQRAFESVKSFAEVTRHTHVMSDCVPDPLLPALSNFLKQIPFKSEQFTVESRRQLLERQMLETQCCGVTDACLPAAEMELPLPDEMQPAAKRMKTEEEQSTGTAVERLDIKRDELYKKVLGDIKSHVRNLMALQRDHMPSRNVCSEVQTIRASLAKFGTESMH